jgi:aminopeptidase N
LTIRAAVRLTLVAITGLIPAVVRSAEIPYGIPRALAQERAARVSDLHYEVGYKLEAHASTTAATEKVRFQLTDASTRLLLDFRDGLVSELRLNGTSIPVDIQHGHLVLPAASLRSGENVVEAKFTANIGAAGKAITRFEDHDDGSEYLYTLFVPMDASMAFPCFDQPDLKGRFKLTITAPPTWSVISNTVSTGAANSLAATTYFAETEPIPTYLFAFAAGPFVSVHQQTGMPNVWVRASKAKSAESEVTAVQTTAAEGVLYLSDYFAQPFPFSKYEMVLIPGFAYGGMEHAGCTFLREESVLFRTAPTANNRFGREVLVLHELTHQWKDLRSTWRTRLSPSCDPVSRSGSASINPSNLRPTGSMRLRGPRRFTRKYRISTRRNRRTVRLSTQKLPAFFASSTTLSGTTLFARDCRFISLGTSTAMRRGVI